LYSLFRKGEYETLRLDKGGSLKHNAFSCLHGVPLGHEDCGKVAQALHECKALNKESIRKKSHIQVAVEAGQVVHSGQLSRKLPPLFSHVLYENNFRYIPPLEKSPFFNKGDTEEFKFLS
jgi:hypothetical protein